MPSHLTWRRALAGFVGLGVVALAGAAYAAGPSLSLTMGGDDPSDTITALKILGLLTLMTLAPSILITMTSFTRIIIVFSFVRHAMGTQSMPPNQVLVGLALFLSMFVMKPVWERIDAEALTPYRAGELGDYEALTAAMNPVKDFMIRQTRQKDLALFYQISKTSRPQTQADVPASLLIPAFVISELKTAFQMGFMLFMPFLLLDMVIASILMAMGMMMLPPILISLPFKVMLFVLVDGWNLLISSLIRSFAYGA